MRHHRFFIDKCRAENNLNGKRKPRPNGILATVYKLIFDCNQIAASCAKFFPPPLSLSFILSLCVLAGHPGIVQSCYSAILQPDGCLGIWVQIPRIYKWRNPGYTRAKDSRRSSFALFSLIQSQRFVGSLNAPFHSYHCAHAVFVIFRGFLDYYDYGAMDRKWECGAGRIASMQCSQRASHPASSIAIGLCKNFVFQVTFPVFQLFFFSFFSVIQLFVSVESCSVVLCPVLVLTGFVPHWLAISFSDFLLWQINAIFICPTFVSFRFELRTVGWSYCKWVKIWVEFISCLS